MKSVTTTTNVGGPDCVARIQSASTPLGHTSVCVSGGTAGTLPLDATVSRHGWLHLRTTFVEPCGFKEKSFASLNWFYVCHENFYDWEKKIDFEFHEFYGFICLFFLHVHFILSQKIKQSYNYHFLSSFCIQKNKAFATQNLIFGSSKMLFRHPSKLHMCHIWLICLYKHDLCKRCD